MASTDCVAPPITITPVASNFANTKYEINTSHTEVMLVLVVEAQ